MSPTIKNKSLLAKRKAHSKKKVSEKSIEDSDVEESLNLLRKKWKVYRVSPLYNFRSNKLRFYEKKLNEEINSKQRLPVICKSKFTLTNGSILNKQCLESLQVEVIKDECQCVYSGHFISLGAGKDGTDGCTAFPILLVEGKENEIQRVHSALCKIFDCDIQPVTLSFFALISFLVKLLETDRHDCDVSSEEITMEYKVPGCDNKDRIKITLILQDTMVVYALVRESLEKKYEVVPPLETIYEFYHKIINHIYNVFQMDLMAAELHKIDFSDASLTADGQVKFTTKEAAASTFSVLSKFTSLDAVINL